MPIRDDANKGQNCALDVLESVWLGGEVFTILNRDKKARQQSGGPHDLRLSKSSDLRKKHLTIVDNAKRLTLQSEAVEWRILRLGAKLLRVHCPFQLGIDDGQIRSLAFLDLDGRKGENLAWIR